jgi:hypothetical protein
MKKTVITNTWDERILDGGAFSNSFFSPVTPEKNDSSAPKISQEEELSDIEFEEPEVSPANDITSSAERFAKAIVDASETARILKEEKKAAIYKKIKAVPFSGRLAEMQKEEERERQKGRERDPFKNAPRPDPFKGVLAKEEGPILKMVLTSRKERVIAWIDYESPVLRSLLLSRNVFRASNGITIGAGEHPVIQQDTIYLLGSVTQYDKISMGWNYNNPEDAEEHVERFLEALREFSNLLRGIDKKEEELATKFVKNDISHVF